MCGLNFRVFAAPNGVRWMDNYLGEMLWLPWQQRIHTCNVANRTVKSGKAETCKIYSTKKSGSARWGDICQA